MSTQGAEFVRSGGKRLPLWQKTRDAGTKRQVQSQATICSVLEGSWKPSTPGFWQAPDASASLGWRFVRQGADHRQLLQGYGNANMEKSGWALAQFGHGERHHHRFCQESQVSTDQSGKFHGCTCAGLSCLWNHQRTSSGCGWIYSQPSFSVFVATREPWPPGSTNRGNVFETDLSITHT